MHVSVKFCSRWAILSYRSVCSFVFSPLIDVLVPKEQGTARLPHFVAHIPVLILGNY